MKFADIVRLSLNSLMHRGLRSWLTILGIVIGVAAVVAIVSVGNGMKQAISTNLGGLGADIITVSPGFSRAMGDGGPERMFGSATAETESVKLTTKDLQIIKSVPGVKYVDGMVSGTAKIKYLSQSISVTVEGVDPVAWKEMTTYTLDSGRFLNAADSNSIVVGYDVANTMFKKTLPVGTQVTVGNKTFKIVGILEKSGGFSSADRMVIMPATVARTIIEDIDSDEFSSIQIKVSDANLVSEITNKTEQRLILSRHVTNSTKDFTITSSQAMQSTISSTMETLSTFLTGIAAVSLLVGAVSVANTMFTSVMERTKQIGTLKALGTTNFEVMKLFLFESSMIGFIGGIIGIFLGFVASGVISGIGLGTSDGPRGFFSASVTVITPGLLFFALGFSVLIGMVSGLIPARKAAKLQPVEALRYE